MQDQTLKSKEDEVVVGAADRDKGLLRRACKTGSFHTPSSSELTATTRVERPSEIPAADTTSPYRVGRVINARYRLLRPLGRGGMGEVWSAQHLSLNTTMAIKFLAPSPACEQSRSALERFRFEAQVSAHLGARTNHVVTIHDAGMDE